ncbi:Acyl transferase domain-containing protein [Nannocystis exedens]|uniref:Acyl transferase domain-containing protein n=1 Tax=Nannocystis exedens TaxID=54 RepID=A0A1I2I373_9BACT|nr:type I polyketide synthase [Nannocystis exedens]PCC68478.1 hybrid non-ribosomal peptide synthase/polyketide synthase [Nannocystis exedens]SFF36098.1 Acyl transferase domain-containing protein [Nannocystis exedens]
MTVDTDAADVDAIAVIAVAGRFPGAPDVEALWANLRAGTESIARFDADELRAAGTAEAVLRDPRHVPAAAVLDDVEWFDAAFFGVGPREAELMDPQQRLFLECCHEALERAGHDPQRFPGAIGVYAGADLNTYLLHLHAGRTFSDGERLQVLLANDKDYLATRVSYKLDLRGPSVAVQTACSTSLVAVHMACQALLHGECDMSLAGGASVGVPQRVGYVYQEGAIHSPDGHCRPFDAAAAGTVPGSGVGVVVLRRLADALADGDAILAVIRGSAINNDGAQKVGYAAPAVEGQARVIEEALAVAGVEAASIGYVEAHGTATPLGDPVELAALRRAFRDVGTVGTCPIGAIKSNFGHAGAAAGVAGLIKTVLSLAHEELPPTLHFSAPNPELGLERSPFFVNRALRPWPRGQAPRRAGVSSFGIGGTNAHVVVEEAPRVRASASARPAHLLVLSAATPTALATATARLRDALERQPTLQLADVAHTLQTGRRALAHRRALVCRTSAEALAGLADEARLASAHVDGARRVAAFLFPGQGTQRPDMGRELYLAEPGFRATIDRCAEVLADRLDVDLRAVLYPGLDGRADASRRLGDTEVAQPALLAVEVALARLWIGRGVRPAALLGDSLGEFAAAAVSGVMSLESALVAVAARGRAMQAAPVGAMLAVAAPEAALAPWLAEGVTLAAVHADDRCVVAGSPEQIAELAVALAARGVGTRPLRVQRAFHSPAMACAVAPLKAAMSAVALRPPQIATLSNVTGTWLTPEQATDPDYWTRHLCAPVRLREGLQQLAADPARVLLELGPGQSLANLARRSGHARVVAGLPMRAPEGAYGESLAALGALWQAGVEVDWSSLYAGERRSRVLLPTYPFERRRHWFDGAATPAAKPATTSSATATSSAPTSSAPATSSAATTTSSASAATTSSATAATSSAPAMLGSAATTTSTTTATTSTTTATTSATTATRATATTSSATPTTNATAAPLASTAMTAMTSSTSSATTTLATTDVASAPSEPPTQLADPPAPGQVEGRLLEVVRATVGVDVTDAERGASFLELGLDSLVLMQLSQAVDAAFGVRVAFRQFFEELATFDALRDHLERHATRVAAPASEAPPAPAAARPAFVPYRPPRPELGARLDPRQQAHLDALVSRLVARTPGSKQRAQADRAVLADNRVTARFRLQWKELVYPIVAARADGAALWDVDGNAYVDLAMGFGVHFFGHAPAFVRAALARAIAAGMPLGPQSEAAGRVARRLCALTGMERATFCNSGTEAVMAALRIARTVTRRRKVALFAGSYHGSFDGTLARGLARDGERRSVPMAPGVTDGMVDDVVVLDYGEPNALEWVQRHGSELAAVLVEPVQSRRPDLQPQAFLAALRASTRASGAALVFDEIITGLRCHPGGAQAFFGVEADLATYGKVLAGGLPIGVVAGRARFMDAIDGGAWSYGDESYPTAEQTFFAGTFCKHPLALAAAEAVLAELAAAGPGLQRRLNDRTAALAHELNARFAAAGAPLRASHFASLFIFEPLAEQPFFDLFFYHLLARSIYVWEGGTCFLSTAHGDDDLERVVAAVDDAVAALQAGGFFGGAAARAPAQPTTPLQQELWTFAQLGPDASAACNEGVSLRLRGALDVAALRRALRAVIDRHEALRTAFAGDGRTRTVAPAVAFDLPVVDVPDADALAARVDALMRRPFALDTAPLVRAELLRLGPDEHLLALVLHHLVVDSWSLGVLVRELAALYSAHRDGVACALPPVTRARLEAPGEREVEVAERYWLARLADGAPHVALPADRPDAAARGYGGAQLRRPLGPGLARSLRRCAQEQGCTLFVALLAGFEALLRLLGGRDETLVGIHGAGQALAGADAPLGYDVRLLPLIGRVDPEWRFDAALRDARTRVFEAFQHQQCPLGRLARAIRPCGAAGPLLDITFDVERSGPAPAFAGLQVEGDTLVPALSKRALAVHVLDDGDDLVCEWTYARERFAPQTIERWHALYAALAELVTRRPDITLRELAAELARTDRALQRAADEAELQRTTQRLGAARRRPIAIDRGED